MDPAPPASSLVSLLLVLSAPRPAACCSFQFSPVSSTFRAHVDALVPWLLQDYPVQMPSNLEQDVSCGDLWGLHFGLRALQHMGGVAGGSLAPRVQRLVAQLSFVTHCHIQDPQGCVRLRPVNVSRVLETLVQQLGGLRHRPPHFPTCARLRCHTAPPASAPPPPQRLGAPAPPSPPPPRAAPAGGGRGGPGGPGGRVGPEEAPASAGWLSCHRIGPPGDINVSLRH